jgi:hypothetical protein
MSTDPWLLALPQVVLQQDHQWMQPRAAPGATLPAVESTDAAACCLQTVAGMAVGAALLRDLLCLELALQGEWVTENKSSVSGLRSSCDFSHYPSPWFFTKFHLT